MPKVVICISIEKKLLKKLTEYIDSRMGKPSRSSIVETALEEHLRKLLIEDKAKREADMSVAD